MASENARGIIGRMIGAARLDVHTFEEVEADTSATKQALLVVAIVALATGIASLPTNGLSGAGIGIFVAIVGWAIWAGIVYLIGTKILPAHGTHADWGQVARALGFAQSPGIVRVFAVVPNLDIIFWIGSAWMLVAMVIAVRQALDYTSTVRAIGVVLLGFLPYAMLMIFVLGLFASAE